MPCPCHAPTMPFFSRARHSTAVERRPVGYLPPFGFFRLPREVPRRLLSNAYQSQIQVASVKPHTVRHGQGRVVVAHYKKDNLLKRLDYQFGYFRLLCELSRRIWHCRSRAGARHSRTAWARNGHGMLCVNRPLQADSDVSRSRGSPIFRKAVLDFGGNRIDCLTSNSIWLGINPPPFPWI